MGSYEIRWKKSAINDLRRIDNQYIRRIIKVIEGLETNPYTMHSKKIKATEHIYRLRIGDYRVVYQIDTAIKAITIFHENIARMFTALLSNSRHLFWNGFGVNSPLSTLIDRAV